MTKIFAISVKSEVVRDYTGFSPEIKIRPNGLVVWAPFAPIPETNIIFDDPTNVAAPSPELCNAAVDVFEVPLECSAGDVHLSFGVPSGRQFPVPGIYPYHITSLGLSGRIVVTDVLN
jgi:hypothetical protein